MWIRDSLPLLLPLNLEKNEGLLNDSLHNEVYSILHYLDDHHGFTSIRNWFSQDIDSILTVANHPHDKDYVGEDVVRSSRSINYNWTSEPDIYMISMGLKAEHIYKDAYTYNSTNYHTEVSNITVISGYDYMAHLDFYGYNSDSLITTITLDSIPYSLFLASKCGSDLYIKSQNETVHFPFQSMTDSLRKKFGTKDQQDIPISKMRMSASTEKFDFKVELNYLTLGAKSDTTNTISFTGKLFIKRK